MILLQLTKLEASYLAKLLNEMQDEGPDGEGWASDLLCRLRYKVTDASVWAPIARAECEMDGIEQRVRKVIAETANGATGGVGDV